MYEDDDDDRRPTILPPRKNSSEDILDRLTLAANAEETRNPKEKTIVELYRQDWYWGILDKEEVSRVLKDEGDGVFFIRNSSTPGDFTMTLNCNKELKLIKITIEESGKCHFQSHNKLFGNITDLIAYYREHSLKTFNATLPLKLGEHLSYSKYIEMKTHRKIKPVAILLHEMYGIHTESERISRRVDRLEIDKGRLQLRGVVLKRALAQSIGGEIMYRKSLVKMEEHCHLEGQKPADPVIMKQNIQRIVQKIKKVNEIKSMTEKEIKEYNEILDSFDKAKDELYKRYYRLEKERDLIIEELLQRKVNNSDIRKGILESTSLVDFEPLKQSEFMLDVVLKFEVDDWLAMDCDKAKAVTYLKNAINKCPENHDGVFLIRPSFSKQGFYALSISFAGKVHHCLIEYRNSSPDDKEYDQSGYGFHKSNLYFAALVDFVKYYHSNSLKEHNQELDLTLQKPIFKVLAM
uniref:SH2 domain-containing protein n=1 Tax=Rhabditophanes sp. KR3021 TaxID=114890 RepID=A0AC35TRP3_9BILA